ncbi:MAG: hypothetical protein M3P26_17275 [Gemmatimonadota bacterium]|nr:hypothetical protein [Gemmatimonadota bacterium]
MITDTFGDFTESEYRRLLGLAREGWRFVGFGDWRKEAGQLILWRHDIDFSPHRALKLAQIENEMEVRATYFVLLNSNFYNALEPPVIGLLKNIRELGHDLALHFDPGAHRSGFDCTQDTQSALELDKRILERYCDTKVTAFSYHNPDTVAGGIADDDHIGGMVNAYGREIRERFSYVSDSNGYWRHRRLRDVLEAREEIKLHALTHPEWWTSEPMSPRDRVTRCIEGRAKRQHLDYDTFLERYHRTNVR